MEDTACQKDVSKTRLSKRCICNILGTAIGIKLNPSGNVVGDVDLSQEILHGSRLSKRRICNILGLAKGIKLKLSGYVEKMLNYIKRDYYHPGCQEGACAMSDKRLGILS